MGAISLPEGYAAKSITSIGTIWFIILGNVIEWFELSSFGFLSTQLDANFFHGNSTAMWSAFAVSFVARPFGAACFGWISDKIGRRLSVILSLAGMIVGTVGQGILPTYTCCGDTGGHVGIVLLIILRIILGFCAGGEIAGVSVYIAEYKEQHVLGAMSAAISVGASIGFTLSTAFIAMLLHVLTEDQMMEWGWRLPFLCSIVPGCTSLILRWTHIQEAKKVILAAAFTTNQSGMNHLQDSDSLESGESGNIHCDRGPCTATIQHVTHKDGKVSADKKVFSSLQNLPSAMKNNDVAKAAENTEEHDNMFPLFAIIRYYPMRFMLGFFGIAACAMGWYIGSIYVVSYVQKFKSVHNLDAMLMGLANSSMSTVVTPFGGILADSIGVGKMHTLSTFILFYVTITFWLVLVLVDDNITVYYIAFAVCGAVQGLCCAVPFLWVAELFPTSLRASGFMSYNLGVTVFGGLSPLVCELLASRYTYGPLVYQAGWSLFAALCVGMAQYCHITGIWKLSNIRHKPF
eukprot:CFRG0009T1